MTTWSGVSTSVTTNEAARALALDRVVPPPPPQSVLDRARWALHDGLVVAKRDLVKIPRIPELLVFSTIQPIMFVLLFAYVFGSAIQIPGINYKEFLMAGIFVQTIAFNSAATAVALAEDKQRGIIDRFRSLPMARSAVLAGRTTADLARGALVLLIMAVCGLIVGWRINSGVVDATAGFALILAFGFAMSWVGAFIGMAAPNTEVANTAGFIWLFPLTFLSNAFVPLAGLPGWLQAVAAWNPVSSVVAAARVLFGNVPPPGTPGIPAPKYWPQQHPVVAAVGWIVVILAIFVPLAIRKYRAATSR